MIKEAIVEPVKSFYRRHLRQYPLARFARKQVGVVAAFNDRIVGAIRIGSRDLHRRIFRLCMSPKLFARFDPAKRWLSPTYNLRTISEFVAGGATWQRLAPAESQVISAANFDGRWRPETIENVTTSISFPEIGVLTIKRGIIVGNFDLFFVGENAMYADQLNIHRDLLVEEMRGDATVQVAERRLRFSNPNKIKKLDVPAAISLVGGAVHNYVHWLTESLPKLLLIDKCEDFRELPLLIDKGLHPNILEALNQFNVHRREVMEVARLQPLRVERLILVSPPCYVPIDYRATQQGGTPKIQPHDVMFSPTAIGAVQEAVGRTAPPGTVADRKLYLRRNSTYRYILNIKEVEEVLLADGFEVVEPERLTFRQQLEIFRRARVIVGQGGAALGNMCLAPPGCRVHALVARSGHVNYHYFSNMADILRHDFSYLAGAMQELKTNHPSHGNFEVDIDELKATLAKDSHAARPASASRAA